MKYGRFRPGGRLCGAGLGLFRIQRDRPGCVGCSVVGRNRKHERGAGASLHKVKGPRGTSRVGMQLQG